MALEYFVDADGNPIPVAEDERKEFRRWFLETDHSIAFDVVEGVRITTVFLGIDHGGYLSGGPPVLWETAVQDGSKLSITRRYSSRADALVGHAGAVAAVTASCRGLCSQALQHDRLPQSLHTALRAWAGTSVSASE